MFLLQSTIEIFLAIFRERTTFSVFVHIFSKIDQVIYNITSTTFNIYKMILNMLIGAWYLVILYVFYRHPTMPAGIIWPSGKLDLITQLDGLSCDIWLLFLLLAWWTYGKIINETIPYRCIKLIECLFYSIEILVVVLILFLKRNLVTSSFQHTIVWTGSLDYYPGVKIGTCYIYFGIDGISLLFIFLTAFIIPLCLLLNHKSYILIREAYSVSILSIGILIIAVFSVLDLVLFYVLFEIILIPFFFMISLAGSRVRKTHASYLLVFYTLAGSMLMLFAIVTVYALCGTTNIQLLSVFDFTNTDNTLLWLCFVISFSIKVPVFPFHLWLPEAHVESPTEGSVILAAVLLKIGLYGFLRIVFPFFSELSFFYSGVMICFNCLSLLYTSLATLKQYDIKRIVAYSSIGHMNICMIGLFTFDIVGSIGSVLLMLGHGFVSSGLFLLIGMLYNRYKTKLITYYSGLVYTMPLWSSFFFLYSIFNISFPGTSNFVGEFLIIYSIVEYGNYCIVAVMLIALFACAAYTIWLTNRILFGMPRIPNTVHCFDMDILEFSILMPITMMVFIVGIFPTIFSELVLLDVSRITNQCL